MVGFTLDIYEPPADTIIIGEGGVMDCVLNINRLELLQKIKRVCHKSVTHPFFVCVSIYSS